MKPLNPIMAVLAIASVGVLPLRTLAADGSAAPDAKAVDAKVENENSIDALTKILSGNPAARADAGKRIEEFLLTSVGGKSFIASDADQKAAGAVARDWGEKSGPVGGVAMFYFVAGPGALQPGWAIGDPTLKKTFVPGGKWEPRLRAALSDWTGKSQITKTETKRQVTAFLSNAAEKAAKVFAEPRDVAAVDGSINRNDNTGAVAPDLTGTGASKSPFGAQQYTLKDLYEEGAQVVDVSGPGDANSRRISMKIFSRRTETGEIVNEIAIYDITDSPRDIFGQRFAIGDGDKSFVLDDRTPGHKKYELKYIKGDNGETVVSFARPGDGGTPLKVGLGDLYAMRAEQAARMRNVININGQDFYTLPQGGSKSGLMMFPKALIDERGKGGDPMNLTPALYAVVGERGSDGRNQNVKPGANGGPMLGKVGDKDYKLVFNSQLGMWEVKEGVGDAPPPPKKPEGSTPGGTTPGGTTPGTDPNGAEMAISDLENLLLKDQNCKKADTAAMADALKGKFGMVVCKTSSGANVILLVPKSMADDQQMVFKSVQGAGLLNGRIVDQFAVLQFDSQVQYLDLRKKTAKGFELVGFVSNKDAGGPPVEAGGRRPGMTNLTIFMDALANYMDVPANAPVLKALPKRVTDLFGGTVDLQAKYSGETLQVFGARPNGNPFLIWPTIVEPPSGTPGGENNQYAKLGGPANVFEPEVSSVDESFKPSIDIANSYVLKLHGAAQKDIALYKYVDPTGKDKTEKYYVSFKYRGQDTATADPASAKTSKIFRQKPFEAFNSDNPLPEGREMQGLTDAKDPIARGQLAYRFVQKATKSKGVLAVFQNGQLQGEGQKDAKANCVGPILWWGVANRDEALKICQADKY